MIMSSLIQFWNKVFIFVKLSPKFGCKEIGVADAVPFVKYSPVLCHRLRQRKIANLSNI